MRTHDAGFGPYHIEEWSPGNRHVLVANPNYYRGPFEFTRVLLREVPEGGSRLFLISAGDVDVAWELNPRQRQTLEGDPNVRVYSVFPSNTYSWLAMTVTEPPFDNKLVRQAVCYALQYQEILDSIYLGSARQQKSPVPIAYQFYTDQFYTDQFWHYDTDPDKARELLEEAGYGEGVDMTISASAARAEHEEIAILLKTALERVGVRVTLEKMPEAAFTEQWIKQELQSYVQGPAPAVADPTYAVALWWYSKENILDTTGYSNPEVDRLIEESRSTLDPEERKQQLYEIQRLIVEDAPMCFIADTGSHKALRANLEGFAWYPDSGVRYYELKSK